jgi:23S rRNA pseudouridine2605 synthase
MEVRLQKILAEAGVASRRKSEELIDQGRVSVDGRVIRDQGVKVDPEKSEVMVDGEIINQRKTKIYLALNKPRGILSTLSDPENRPHLGDLLRDRPERLFHVGRLDKESEGLLLLTNDGELAHRATHPSFSLPKNYLLEVKGSVSKEVADSFKKGVALDDGMAKVDKLTVLPGREGRTIIDVVIHDGRNQILRRMAAASGLTVERLIRIGMGPIKLGELTPGKWREIKNNELLSLQNALQLKL